MIPKHLLSTAVVFLLMTPLLLASTTVVRGPDTTPPEVISYYPLDHAFNIPVDASLYVNFSEPMIPATVTLTTVPPMSFDPPLWSLGTDLVLSHSMPFMASMMYTVTVNGTDLAGNWLDGNKDGTSGDPFMWSFSTNCGGICIVKTDPRDGEVNVPVNSPIIVTFSEKVNPSVFTITIDPPLSIIIGWDSEGTVLTIQHATPFSMCTLYTVTITSPTIVPGPVPNPWHFTTAGCAPMIMHIEPPQNDALISAAIVIDFSEEIDADTVTWSLNRTVTLDPAWGFENRTLTLTHAVKFLPCTAYRLTVAGKDKIGRDLVPGPVENPYNFTTLCTYPRVTQTSPFSTQTNVPLDATISVMFSESMDNDSVMDCFTYRDDRMVVFTKSDGVFEWNTGNTSFTFSPNSPFRGQVTYTVNLNASIAHGLGDNFLDGNGNGMMDLPRFEDNYYWQFTTARVNDLIPPTVQSVYPEPNATDVARDVTVSIVFSEPMNKPSVQGSIEAPEEMVAYDFVWPNNRTVSFRLILPPATLMSYATNYGIKVRTSATDLVGNHMAEQYSWSFTTLYWRGTVHGRVVDESDGSPIADATVVLGGVSTLTDSNGNFSVANVLQQLGIWLNVTKDGYEDNRSLVSVGEGSQNLGVIKLRKIQPPSQTDVGLALILVAVIVAVVFIILFMLALRRRGKVQPARFEEWKGEVAEVEPGDEGN